MSGAHYVNTTSPTGISDAMWPDTSPASKHTRSAWPAPQLNTNGSLKRMLYNRGLYIQNKSVKQGHTLGIDM